MAEVDSVMKTARYTGLNGADYLVEYDETAPCKMCGEPVVTASMGGTDVCPWCDNGNCRYCGVGMGFAMISKVDRWREHVHACGDRVFKQAQQQEELSRLRDENKKLLAVFNVVKAIQAIDDEAEAAAGRGDTSHVVFLVDRSADAVAELRAAVKVVEEARREREPVPVVRDGVGAQSVPQPAVPSVDYSAHARDGW